MINTTTGDLVRKVNLLPIPRQFAAARVLAGQRLITTFGCFGMPSVIGWPTRELVAMLAVGPDADPAVAALVYDLFAATAPAGRGGCAKMLATRWGGGTSAWPA